MNSAANHSAGITHLHVTVKLLGNGDFACEKEVGQDKTKAELQGERAGGDQL